LRRGVGLRQCLHSFGIALQFGQDLVHTGTAARIDEPVSETITSTASG
jgi:hypothetical protein